MSLFDALQGEYEPEDQFPLLAEDVREIRRLYATGKVRQVDLAAEYGISQPQISKIVNFKQWRTKCQSGTSPSI
jgi:hypothetical protein